MFRADRLILLIILTIGVPVWGASPIVYSWNPLTNQPGLVPLSWMACSDAPTTALSKIAGGFAKLPQAQRGLLISGILYFPPIFSPANLKTIVENGPNCTAEIAYLQLIFTQMKARSLVPARIVLDLEGAVSTWSLTPAGGNLSTVLMPIYNDSACYAKLPASLKQYSPADFDNFMIQRGWNATNAWNAWEDALVAQALRQTVSATANKVFQINIPVTNYQDLLPSFAVYDQNGWPFASAAVGSESSPSLYVTVTGNRYLSLQKDARWNHFIDCLNQARSAIRNGPVVPWVSYPSYGGDSLQHGGSTWLWRELIKHLNAMGIKQYLYFNSGDLLSDEQYASKVFQSMQTPDGSPEKSWGAIPLDSASVTTGTVTTTYTDFLSNLLGGTSAIIK
jgi:hypothetical protein